MKALVAVVSMLAVVGMCKWEDPITLWKGQGSTYILGRYVDSRSGDLHILGVTYEDREWWLIYAKMRINGEYIAKKILNSLTSYSYGATVAITGPNDGKTLYVTVYAKKKQYYDIHFSESRDNGETWSEPIIARKGNEEDGQRRSYPSILLLKSGKLMVLYHRSGVGIKRVTRDPETKEWSEEDVIEFNGCENAGRANAFNSLVVPNSEGQTILISIRCYSDELLYVGESPDGQKWKVHTNPQLKDAYGLHEVLTYNPNTGRVFIAIHQDEGYNYHLATVFEHALGQGSYDKMFATPVHNLGNHALISAKIGGEESMIHLASVGLYGSEEEVWCRKYNIDKPWKMMKLPPPVLGSQTSNLEFHLQKGYLLAVGRGSSYEITVQRFQLDQRLKFTPH